MRTNLSTLRKKNPKEASRLKRKLSVRKKISGSSERPRLTIFRSARHIYAQVVNDVDGRTLVQASSLDKDLRDGVKGKAKADVAKAIGEALAAKAVAGGVSMVVFDRNGRRYGGRLQAFADGARSKGLQF